MPYAYAPRKTGDAYQDAARADAAQMTDDERDARDRCTPVELHASCSECGDGSGALVMDADGKWLCRKCELKYVAADMRSDSERDRRCEERKQREGKA